MILSAVFYAVFAVWSVACFAVMCVLWALTAWWDGPRIVLHRFSRVWSMGYFRLVPGWKLTVEGRENIARGGTWVVVANHRSMFDIVLMYALPLRNFKWVSKREVYRWPLFGWVLWMHGDVAIERGTAAGVRTMMREGTAWLEHGVSIVVFPEGSRNGDGDLGRFRDGAFRLAREAGVEVLPVVTSGTGTIFDGRLLNLRNGFRVRILPPMEADMEKVRRAMEKAGVTAKNPQPFLAEP